MSNKKKTKKSRGKLLFTLGYIYNVASKVEICIRPFKIIKKQFLGGSLLGRVIKESREIHMQGVT